MDKEVLIHVRGLQTMDADGEQEPLEIVVPGQYYLPIFPERKSLSAL